jgi:hypothetical protein
VIDDNSRSFLMTFSLWPDHWVLNVQIHLSLYRLHLTRSVKPSKPIISNYHMPEQADHCLTV